MTSGICPELEENEYVLYTTFLMITKPFGWRKTSQKENNCLMLRVLAYLPPYRCSQYPVPCRNPLAKVSLREK